MSNPAEMSEMTRMRIVTQSVPDHEVLLVFDGGVTAERFTEWLETLGWGAFTAWHAEMEHDIEHHEGTAG